MKVVRIGAAPACLAAAGLDPRARHASAMIVSHRYQFIFVKTRKTAGTSVEISLSRYCGPLDILTPFEDESELLRAKLGLVPQNYLEVRSRIPEGFQGTEEEVRTYLNRPVLRQRFGNHASATTIRHRVGKEVWDRYYKFAVERDPLEHLLSDYSYKNRNNKYASVSEFLKSEDFFFNHKLYCIDGRVAVDRVIDYDTLVEELSEVCDRLGIPFDGWLPRTKADATAGRRPPAEVFTPAEISLVRRLFSKEYAVLDAARRR